MIPTVLLQEFYRKHQVSFIVSSVWNFGHSYVSSVKEFRQFLKVYFTAIMQESCNFLLC